MAVVVEVGLTRRRDLTVLYNLKVSTTVINSAQVSSGRTARIGVLTLVFVRSAR
jgi:hypothetical protein